MGVPPTSAYAGWGRVLHCSPLRTLPDFHVIIISVLRVRKGAVISPPHAVLKYVW